MIYSTVIIFHLFAIKVLTNREYQQWLLCHIEAEQSMEGRDEKIYDSYIRLERELELLGATGIEDRYTSIY